MVLVPAGLPERRSCWCALRWPVDGGQHVLNFYGLLLLGALPLLLQFLPVRPIQQPGGALPDQAGRRLRPGPLRRLRWSNQYHRCRQLTHHRAQRHRVQSQPLAFSSLPAKRGPAPRVPVRSTGHLPTGLSVLLSPRPLRLMLRLALWMPLRLAVIRPRLACAMARLVHACGALQPARFCGQLRRLFPSAAYWHQLRQVSACCPTGLASLFYRYRHSF